MRVFFFSSIISLPKKFYYHCFLFLFWILNFVYYLLNFLFHFKFIVALYFSGKLTAVGEFDDFVQVIWNSSRWCNLHFSMFFILELFFLFHFLITDMDLLLVAFQNLKLRLCAISHFRALAPAIFQSLSFLFY